MSYPIKVELIPGLPRIAYDGGIGKYLGTIAHATANYNDNDESERSYESRTFNNAFVHFFVDATGIVQVADTDYVAFGAGHKANHRGYVHVELCQTKDPAKFAKAYAMYAWLHAKLLFDHKLGVKDNATLLSHAEASADFHDTNHQDPIAYLASHGKTWAQFIADVTAQYNLMAAPAPAPVPTAAGTYTVQANDTLWGIATKHHITVDQLKAWNKLTSDVIHPSQVLRVTAPVTAPVSKPAPAAAPKPSPAPAPAHKYATVTASLLHVRSGPGTNYPVIGSLRKDSKVLIANTAANGWECIYFGAHGGFVDGTYLK